MIRVLVLATMTVFASLAAPARVPAQTAQLPYRFLLVISDQWKDPASYVIDEGGEFQILAGLMKSWGLPFEILRLDQQRLDKYHLLDREGRPRYGTIIWDAGPDGLQDKGLDLVPELVKRYGVNLVVLADTVAAPEISELAGLQYASDLVSGDTLAIVQEHFVTRDWKGARERSCGRGSTGPGLRSSRKVRGRC